MTVVSKMAGTPSETSFVFKAVASYSCSAGHALSGAKTVECGDKGAPSADAPVCVDVDECATDNGGCTHNCVNSVGSHTCTCDPGYDLMYQVPPSHLRTPSHTSSHLLTPATPAGSWCTRTLSHHLTPSHTLSPPSHPGA